MTKQEVLTPLQKKFLSEIFSNEWFRRHFYLTGGTALSAFYYQHRYSEDLDFFSHHVELLSIPPLMEKTAKKLCVPYERVQTAPGFMRFKLDRSLQVDMVADVAFRVGSPELRENFMVDSLKNIAVNKVGCILGRLDTKDYVDLYWILKNETYDIFELMSLGRQKDGGLEPFVWASLIADVQKLSILPRMVQSVTLKEIEKFFLKLRDQILHKIKPGKNP